MIITVALLLILFACVAMMATEGLWSNAIMLVNVMTAALIATNYFEPLATWLTAKGPAYTYVIDFFSLWGLFCVSLIIMRLITDKVSRVKVKFKVPVEWAGSIFFALWTGWLMVCFTLFSLHTAPLARSFMGFQEEPMSDMFFGTAPDKQWLAFIHGTSKSGGLRAGHAENQADDTGVFDPKGDFIFKYANRRHKFEDVKYAPDILVRSED